MRLHRLLVIILLGTSLAHADTFTQFFYLKISNSSVGERTVPLNTLGFDPSLGTLNALRAELNGSLLFAPTAGSNQSAGISLFADQALLTQSYTGDGYFQVMQSGTFTDPSTLAFVTGPNLTPFALGLYDGGGDVFSIASGSITYDYTANAVPASVTPEPSALLLLATGVLATAAAFRRKLPAAH